MEFLHSVHVQVKSMDFYLLVQTVSNIRRQNITSLTVKSMRLPTKIAALGSSWTRSKGEKFWLLKLFNTTVSLVLSSIIYRKHYISLLILLKIVKSILICWKKFLTKKWWYGFPSQKRSLLMPSKNATTLWLLV